jgi:hypothetical protein
MTKPVYQVVENNYPADRFPCDQTTQGGALAWENQCAIRMSIALVGAGVGLSGYRDPKCKHGHARGAESLANFLWRAWGRPRIFRSAVSARSHVAARQGVIFFKDIEGFRGGRGDHIDIWDGVQTRTGEYFERSTQTWFFEL